jgi:ligand-binding sensor domain-containing protein
MLKNVRKIMLILTLFSSLLGCSQTKASDWVSYRDVEFAPEVTSQMIEDRDGNLWFATLGHVHFYDRSTGKWSIKLEVGQFGLGESRTLALGLDGAVWVGTDKGLARYDPSGRWQAFTGQESLPNQDIRAILFDRRGKMWVGTGGGGVYTSEDGGYTWRHVIIEEGFSYFTVHTLYEDSRGHVWVAGNALYRYESEQDRWSTYTDGTSRYYAETEPLPGTFVLLVGETLTPEEAARYIPPPPETVVLADDFILVIVEDGNGYLWFGTLTAGVMRYDPAGNEWTNLTSADGLFGDKVQSIEIDPAGNFWFGGPRGVSRYNPHTNEWTTFNRENAFTNFITMDILADSQGQLWFATFWDGVYRYDPQE